MKRAFPRRDPPSVRCSTALYQRLLVVYPTPFRRVYGEHLVQVFRDSCRQAQRECGLPGLLALWLPTLADLTRTALAEHLAQGTLRSRGALTQLGGLLTLGGSALFFVLALDLELTALIPPYRGITYLLAEVFFSGSGLYAAQFSLLAVQSATQFCCVTGLVALLLVQHNKLGQIVGGLALLGQLLLAALNAPLLWLFTGGALPPLLVNWLEVSWKLAPLLASLLGGVLLVYGCLPLRHRSFSRGSVVLLLLGGWMLLGGLGSIDTLPQTWVAIRFCGDCVYNLYLFEPMRMLEDLFGTYDPFLLILTLLWGCLGAAVLSKKAGPARHGQPEAW